MNHQKLGWGIIAPGIIANKFAEALEINGSVLEAVASRDKKRSDEFKEIHHAKKSYGSYEAMLQDPDVDIVYISNPHSLHKEWIIKSLKMGKHVLCEKPVTVTADEFAECMKAAKEYNRFLMEAIWTRFLPIYQNQIQRIIEEKILGDIRIINIDYSFNGNPDPEYRILNKQLAGGAVLDVGIYALHLCDLFLGKPSEIKTVCHIGTTGVDLQSAIAMKFEGLSVATITTGIACTGTEWAQIIGTKGRLVLKDFGKCELAELYLNCQNPQTIEAGFENGFQFEILECEKCISDGRMESKIIPHAKSLEIMGTMDKIRETF